MTRTPDNEENVLCLQSTCAIDKQLGLSQSTVWKILSRNQMHSYHLQHIQALDSADYSLWRNFASWYLEQSVADRAFTASILLTDGAFFTLNETFNQCNVHLCTLDNPHGTRTRAAQMCLSVNI
ncbi:hypothetical protein X975_13125, partial [Stegodyphus mimosarum]